MGASYPPHAIPYPYSPECVEGGSRSLPRLPHRCHSTKARPRAPTLWPPSALLRAPSAFLRVPLPLPSVFLRPSSVLLPALFPVPWPHPPPPPALPSRPPPPLRRSRTKPTARRSVACSAMRWATVTRRLHGPGPC